MDKLKKSHMLVPMKPPYELTWEYLQSKAATRQMIKLFDCGDYILEANVRTSNYFARQKLMNAEKLLESRRALAAKRRTELDEQWEDLQKRENELRQMFIKFNEFVIENSDKRTRTDQSIAEQKVVWEQRQKQIENTLNECNKIEKIKQAMSKKLVSYKLYEDFLNSMVEMFPTDFSSILDIINRYDVIKHTSQTLAEHQSIELRQLEMAKRELAKTVERYIVQLSGLNTRVASLQQRFDSVKRESQKWEELYERIRAKATQQVIDVVSIKDSCWRIYKGICERKGVEPVFKDNYAKQLDVIKKTLRDYRRINDLGRMVEAEKAYVSLKPCVSKGTD